MIPYSREAYKLLHDGTVALAQVESNGICVDTVYLAKAIRRTTRRIKHLQAGLEKSEVAQIWRKTFKAKTNLNSTDQLGKVLFGEMGFDCVSRTSSLKYSTDEKALAAVDHPFVKDYLQVRKLQKSLGTYLLGIQREVVEGKVHPNFSLHLVRTFRSSSDNPNFQNIPIRDPKIGELVRQAFVARPGHRLVELDYSGIEVSIAATYHQDPTMHGYLRDKSKDMHRDMAMECYKLPPEEMLNPIDKDDAKRIKTIRYCGKNMFVFPQFYGDWYVECARNLWEAIGSMKLHLRDGRSLKEHLHQKGIVELGALDFKEKPRPGTFEAHIQAVEKRFWEKRFPVYASWKKKWVAEYREKAWMLTKTGFICQGWMKKNEIINYPVQGSAFHCLLWALIQLQKELNKRKMRSLIVGQIHDSLINDVPKEELTDFLGLAHEVMVPRLLEAWKWINVPLETEAEVTPVGGSWFQKEVWKHGS